MALGHIDEVVSFATTADGRARVASPEAAWALLRIAQISGSGADVILQNMNGHAGTTVDQVLAYDPWRDANFGPFGYSERLLHVRNQLGLVSPVSEPTSGNGAPDNVLRRAGYLDVYDNLFIYGDEIEWQLEFVNATDYTISYRQVGESGWHADRTGSRDQDSVSNSRVVYVLRNWWGPGTTATGQTVTFRTRPSPNMIETPVLFCDHSGALACTNNVVNSLVDGVRLFVADVSGPSVGGRDLFDWYVDQAAQLVGFTNAATQCEERVYHNGAGSIHCGTNVLREIPADRWWDHS